jgi:hypothetical protein
MRPEAPELEQGPAQVADERSLGQRPVQAVANFVPERVLMAVISCNSCVILKE